MMQGRNGSRRTFEACACLCHIFERSIATLRTEELCQITLINTRESGLSEVRHGLSDRADE